MTYEKKQEIYKSACYGMGAADIAEANSMPLKDVQEALDNTAELEEVRDDLKAMGVIK